MTLQKTSSTEHEIGQADWLEAQQWEKEYWDRFIRKQRSLKKLGYFKTLAKKVLKRGPDESSNLWWARHFDDYHFVPDRLENVIEFGCGPSTNLRIILHGRQTDHVVASDPLARHYITYKGYYLAKRWKMGDWFIDDHAMEEPFFADDVFDLAVCINVLDHVRSVDLCMKTLVRVVKPGGLLLLGQELTNDDDLKATERMRLAARSDTGHPHKFETHEILRPYLSDFVPVLDRVVPREQVRLPEWHCGTFVFAGKKNRA
jgi:2-polyprenyl-3-methyl-5-hydroxy-6-metoxy-1,4-benzoquinol methylase